MGDWRRYDENDCDTFPPAGRMVLLAFYSAWSTSPTQISPWYMGIGVAEKDGKIRRYEGNISKRLDGYDKLHLKAWMLFPNPPKDQEAPHES